MASKRPRVDDSEGDESSRGVKPCEVRLEDEQLRSLMNGQTHVSESSLTRSVLLEYLRQKGTVVTVNSFNVTVCPLEGSQFTIKLDDKKQRVSTLKEAIQNAQGAAVAVQSLFMLESGQGKQKAPGKGKQKEKEKEEESEVDTDNQGRELADCAIITGECSVLLCLHASLEWTWHGTRRLIGREDNLSWTDPIEFSGPHGSIAELSEKYIYACEAIRTVMHDYGYECEDDDQAKLLEGNRNCLDIAQPMAEGVHTISFEVSHRWRRYCINQRKITDMVMVGVIRSDQIYFDMNLGEHHRCWALDDNRMFAPDAENVWRILPERPEGVLTMQLDMGASTLRFWVDGKQYGTGFADCRFGVDEADEGTHLRWFVSFLEEGASAQIVANPELEPWRPPKGADAGRIVAIPEPEWE